MEQCGTIDGKGGRDRLGQMGWKGEMESEMREVAPRGSMIPSTMYELCILSRPALARTDSGPMERRIEPDLWT